MTGPASPLVQIVADGLFTGAAYALMAAGLVLILGVVKVVNLSHGAFFTLGAYVAYSLSVRGFANPAAAAAIAAAVGYAFGLFMGRSFINPVRTHPFSVAVGTLGFTLLAEQVAQSLWGPHALSVAQEPPLSAVLGVMIRRQGVVCLVVSAALIGGLALFLRSRHGLPLKLIAEDEEIASAVGMDVERIRALTFAAASAAAAVAGALLAPATAIAPTMGRGPLILSLIVVIASGMERTGAVFGLAVALGILSSAEAYLLDPQWSYALMLAAVCALLALRPALPGLSGAGSDR